MTWAYVTLTQSWFNLEMATFTPDWSVSTEWFFYFAFVPLTLLVTKLHRPTLVLIVLCAVCFAGLIVLFHFRREQLAESAHRWFWHGDNASADAWSWLFYFSPYVRVVEFVCGMIGAKAYQINKSGGPAPIWAWVILVIGMGWVISVLGIEPISAQPLLANITPNFIFAPAIIFLMLYCCQYETALSRILGSRPLLFLGEISYSVYVWSFFVITMLSGYLVGD